MSLKSKLIASISAFCLIIATLCVGAWAMQVQTTDWGGDINFTASYISATISKATLSGVSHVNSADSSSKMQAVTITSNTTTETLQADANFHSWTNLKLKLTSSTGTGSISFTITNTHTNLDEYIDVTYDVTSAMDDNMAVYIRHEGSLVIAPNSTTTQFTINFKVLNSEIDGNIFDFGISFDLKRILPVTGDDLEYLNVEYDMPATGQARINGASGGDWAYREIPSVIGQEGGPYYLVTAIGDNAFESTPTESLILPNSITYIGEYAFKGSALDSIASSNKLFSNYKIILPNSIDYVGWGAFAECMTWSVKLSSSLDCVQYSMFSGCTGLKSIEIPYGVEYIDGYAFENCSSLTNVKIPETVTRIEYRAFAYCGLTEIKLPSSLQSLGGHTFAGNQIKEVVLPNRLTTVAGGEFYDNDVMEKITIPFVGSEIRYALGAYVTNAHCFGFIFDPSGDGSGFNGYVPSSLQEVVITAKDLPSGTSPFSGCNIRKITLAEGIKTIPDYAFACCSIEEINIPNSVKSIGAGAFGQCNNLRALNIPHGVTSIGVGALEDCFSLESLTLPVFPTIFDGQETFSVLGFAFSTETQSGLGPDEGTAWNFECLPASLKEVTITNTTNIGAQLFGHCQYIETINLPEGLKTIGDMAFLRCESLKKINIPNGVTTIPYRCFEGCTSLESLELPDSITTLSQSWLNSCSSIEKIVIPEGVTSLGNYSLSQCTSLKEVYLPQSLRSINAGAFYRCFALKRLVIPAKVKSMGAQAFRGCFDMTLIMQPKVPPTLYEHNSATPTFQDASNLTIIVPAGSEAAYLSATNWKYYTDYIY